MILTLVGVFKCIIAINVLIIVAILLSSSKHALAPWTSDGISNANHVLAIKHKIMVDEIAFTIQPKMKAMEKATIQAFVLSAPQHFERRNIIRSTWANTTTFPQIQTVFMVGIASQLDINRKLEEEALKYTDIVQADFIDTYYNLTLKTLMGLKWMSINKHDQTPFVLKIDDDVVVNPFQLVEFLNSYLTTNDVITHDNKLICKSWTNAVAVRDKSSKFYVTQEEYDKKTYPTYCDGPAYILTGDLPRKLYDQAIKSMYHFKFEDIYVAILAQNLKTTIMNITDKYVRYEYGANDTMCIFFYVNSQQAFSSRWAYLVDTQPQQRLEKNMNS